MSNLHKISAEARAKRIAEKLAHQNEIEELVEFLDSAIEQSPKFAWGLQDIPNKDIYEKPDDLQFRAIVNLMSKYGEVRQPLVRPYISSKFKDFSNKISNLESKIRDIKDFSIGVADSKHIEHVVLFNQASSAFQQSRAIAQVSNYSKFNSISETPVDSSYQIQCVILEPSSPIVQRRNKTTKT